MNKIAYPGTFDPFHNGHKYIVDTLSSMFDEVHILVFDNINKKVTQSIENRAKAIDDVFTQKNIFVHMCKDSLVEELTSKDIKIVGRGIRNDQDLNIELQRSSMLKQISQIDTIFIPSVSDYVFISSSIIRELIYLGKDINKFVPPKIQQIYLK